MKLAIVYILIIGLLLTGMSYIYQMTPRVYTEEDTRFAKSYAAEMQASMEKMQQQASCLSDQTKPTACDFYLDGQDRFYLEKHAAVHYKREIAEDFVYAFALAEDWCRYASRAAYDKQDAQSQLLAEERYRKAWREFQAIKQKDYVQFNAKR